MTVSPDLFLSILAMDVYNRGYGPGINLGANSDVSDGSVSIGNATVSKNLKDAGLSALAEAAGFYAIAYTLADGSSVISYRGTDVLPTVKTLLHDAGVS